MKALILAGGGGTRLWPASRLSKPKQFIPLYESRSLLRLTYERVADFFSPEDIWLATATSLKKSCKNEVPEINNYSLEPIARNTAPAIGLALLHILSKDPEAIVVTINSDHYIHNTADYLQVIKQAEKIISTYPNKLLLIGLKTQHPETGYGYIKRGMKVEQYTDSEVYLVNQFVEKPDAATAKLYHQSEDYLWNPAIFVFYAKHLLNLYAKHLPEHYKLLQAMQPVLDDETKINKFFSQMENISIDYGILEKEKDLLVLPASFGWSDIGSWPAVAELLPQDGDNKVKGMSVNIASHNNIIVTEDDCLVATIGVDDMIIVQTKDAVLVAKKDQAQAVRQVVAELQKKELNKFL
jgi:mannose-1-phosphate guanylyltransferase